jgi:RNA polymerase sigma factor (sigma-70 family)
MGDARAFEELYDRHHASLLAFCRHMVGNREDGEDALQQTFLRAHRALASGPAPDAVRPWLFAIARNRCRTLMAARRPAAVPADDVDVAFDGLADDVRRRADLRELVADLARLPEDQRGALVLHELGDLAHTEIATVLGCPPEKVKALVFQARTALIADRAARATPCEEIRGELEVARGGALRRGPLRRHLRQCEPCDSYRLAVARQRTGLALILPVAPTAGLKAAILGSAATTAGGAATAAGGAAAGGGAAATSAGGATTAGGAAATSAAGAATALATGGGAVAASAVAAKALIAKVAIAAVVTGAGATGGAVAIERADDHRPATLTADARPVAGGSERPGAAAPAPASTTPAGVPASPPSAARRRARLVRHIGRRARAARRRGVPTRHILRRLRRRARLRALRRAAVGGEPIVTRAERRAARRERRSGEEPVAGAETADPGELRAARRERRRRRRGDGAPAGSGGTPPAATEAPTAPNRSPRRRRRPPPAPTPSATPAPEPEATPEPTPAPEPAPSPEPSPAATPTPTPTP